MILSHGSTGNHPDHFAMYLIRYALTIIIFVLENLPKPKKQYIFLVDEDEVGWPCIKKTFVLTSYVDGLSRRENKYFW